MADVISNVMVIGASGNLGQPVVSELLASKTFKVSALMRVSSTATFPDSVTAIKTDYSHPSLLAAFKGQDAVVCTIATSNLTGQKRIIDAAVEAGVRRFIPSEFGWDTSDEAVLKVAPCVIMKRDVVSYLKEKEATGMIRTSVVTGLWVDSVTKAPGWPWWKVKEREFTRFDDGEALFEASTLRQVGRAIAAILSPSNLAETKNTYVYIHSYSVTQNQLLQVFERATGGAEWSVVPNKVKDINAAGQEIFYRLTKDKPIDELGDVPEFQLSIVLMICSGCFGLGGVNQFVEKTKYWMDKLGLKEEDPAIILKETVAEIEAQA